jgi:hypothetical protein
MDPAVGPSNRIGVPHGSQILKKLWIPTLAGNIIARVFQDLLGILVMDYMTHKTSLTGIVCDAVPQNLKEATMKNDDRGL